MRPSRFLPCFLASLLAAGALASPARAADPVPAEPAAPPAEPSTHWYGYQTLATDGGALAFAVALAASHDQSSQQGLAVGTLAVYGLGGPTVHFAHQQVGKGFLDLGLRLGLPVLAGFVGGLIGYAAAAPSSAQNWFSKFDGEVTGAAFGGLAGVVGASTIDAVFLAREPASAGNTSDAPASAPPPVSTSKATIAPSFTVTPERQGGGTALLGLTGRF
jgi:hypothetical protein